MVAPFSVQILWTLPTVFLLMGCSSPGQAESDREAAPPGVPNGLEPVDELDPPMPVVTSGLELPSTTSESVPPPPPPPAEPVILEELPEGFVGARSATAETGRGGWLVVGSLSEVPNREGEACANVLRGVSRDFPASHSDFQAGSSGLVEGIVADAIGEDRKPVFIGEGLGGTYIANQDSFDEWYRNVPGVNQGYVIDLWLEPEGESFVFDSNEFFPLKELGYAQEACTGCNGQSEGFHFTTELHTRFEYKGGEVFNFRGDDDVWVFINGVLAVDLGGVHGPVAESILLNDFAEEANLEIGQVYTLDLFHAERQTSGSNFRIETTLDFSDCGEILEEDLFIR
ncbi:MAG: fibro-slime domain-containing protein [Polyangiaceae bacterium]|nr:fibro-slime domain-containing protein [Polyangiaceae bacterium]